MNASIVYVPYVGTSWMCRVSGDVNSPTARIIEITKNGVWLDADVVLDSLFLHGLESALHAMPSNTEPNLSWPRSIA